jgi:hypothetical protein
VLILYCEFRTFLIALLNAYFPKALINAFFPYFLIAHFPKFIKDVEIGVGMIMLINYGKKVNEFGFKTNLK